MSDTKWRREIGLFMAGQTASMFGSMIVQYVITWHVTLATRSGSWMTLFTCAGLLPMVLISPAAGVWADRFSRKLLVNTADACVAAATLVLAGFFMAGVEDIRVMLAAVVIRGLGQGVQQPAMSALIPQMVPKEQLARFNGMNSSAQSLIMFASPMLAGLLISFMPVKYIFFVDVITAVFGIACVCLCVHVPAPARRDSGECAPGFREDLMSGLRFIRSSSWLATLLGSMAFFGVFMTPAAILSPLQVTRSFGADIWKLTAVELTFSLGMAVGGASATFLAARAAKTGTLISSCAAFGAATLLLGVAAEFWAYLAVIFLCGFFAPFFNTCALTTLQRRLDPALTGRVFSVVAMINGLVSPVGMAVFGPLGDMTSIEALMVASGVILTAAAALAALIAGRRARAGAGRSGRN